VTDPAAGRSPAETGEAGPARFDRRLLGPMIVGSILNPINSSIIAVALVPIGRAFDAPTSQTAWLVSALYLATSIGQPVVGRLVDLFGPKPLFLVGATLTGIAGVLGTLAPNLPVLVLARVILGFGTCAGYPASMYLIRSESRRTGLASPSGVLTALAVSSQTIMVIGPTLGGVLIGLGGWRATFAVNIPLALASFVLAAAWLPTISVARKEKPDLDLPGIALFATMLVSLLLFGMNPDAGQAPLLAVTVAAAGLLARRELRTPEPFLDLRVLGGNVPLLLTYARMLLAMTVAYAVLYGFTQWAEDSRHLTASQAGLLLIPLPLAAIGVSALTGRHPQIRGKLLTSAVTQVVGCLLLLTLTGHSAIWVLVVVATLFGAAQGLSSLGHQNAVYHQADGARLGSSAGLLRTFAYLGAIVAAAAGGAFFGRTADTPGLHHLSVFLLVAAAGYLVLVVGDRSLARVGRPAGLRKDLP
jgi:MFS family permease